MRSIKNTNFECPACGSRALVDGRILGDGSEDGHSEKFFPSGVKLLSLRRSVRLIGRQVFKACTNCGHVWNTLDATELRDLIETRGTDQLKTKLATRTAVKQST